MRTMTSKFYLLLCLLMCVSLAGCSSFLSPPSPSFKRHTPEVMPQLTIEQLLEECWLTGGQRYLCRHSGLLELFMRKVPLEGVMKLDTVSNEARLVALDTMGVKLFDLSVNDADYRLNYLLPLLEEHRQLPEMVAKSVRQIFLRPYPVSQDHLTRTSHEYRFDSQSDPGIQFRFSGMPVRLHSKTMNSDKQHWQVDYYQYENYTQGGQQSSLWAPTGIVLNDDSGFGLTLWIEEIKKL